MKQKGNGDLVRAGDLLPKVTLAKGRLIQMAAEIAISPAAIDDACYLPAVLCQVGMPRKRTPGLTFERTSGSSSLLLTAGRLWNGSKWIQQALPYGPKPRLILVNLTSSAVLTGQRSIDVGRSTREFMTKVGLDPQGSEYRSLRQQIGALSACRMQLGAGVGDKATSLDTQPIRRFEAWITPNEDQQTLWPGTVELSQEYFDHVREYAVPLDERAIAAMRGSALALDVYCWLAHRLCRVKYASGSKISWVALRAQFGQEYRNADDFRQKFRAALKQVMSLYRAARIEGTGDGLLLRPSAPPIPKVQVGFVEKHDLEPPFPR